MIDVRKLVTAITLFLVVPMSCKDDDDDIDIVEPVLPSISVSVSGLAVVDGTIPVTVIEDSNEITVAYTVTTSSTIKQFVQQVDGTEETVAEATGLDEYSGELVLTFPYANKTIAIALQVTDENDLFTSETLSIEVSKGGDFLVEGDIQITGNVRQGEEIVITGVGFGSGPNVILYDDFEGAHNDPIPLNSPLLGAWTGKSSNYIARFYDYAYSGSTSYSMQDELAAVGQYGGKRTELKVTFDNTQEVFLSYQVAVPPGKHFPGAPTREEWGSASHWKLTWLMDTDNGFKHDDGLADLCIPTNGQAKALQIVGNTDNIGWVASLDELFDIDGFNRMTAWVRADPAEPAAKGYTWIQWLSAKTAPAFTREHIKPVFNAGATSPTSYQWNQLNVPGWFGNSLVNPGGVYDDIYLATGANSPARVEIGDAPDYADCTELSIMPSTSWSDTEIKVIVKTKRTETISQKYLFVFNGSNELIEGGILIP